MAETEPIFGGEADAERYGGFSLRDFARIVFSHKLVILTCFVLITSLVVWGLAYLPLTYATEAKVLIQTSQEASPSFFSSISAIKERTVDDPVNRLMETEMELIEAYPLSERVVRELDLDYYKVYHKPYMRLLKPVFNFYDYVLEHYLGVKPDPDNGTSRDPATVTAFIKSLQVMPIKSKSADTNSNIIGIKLRSPDPKIGYEALTRLLEYYRVFDVKMNDEAAAKAETIVQSDMVEADKQLKAAQARLNAFASKGAGGAAGAAARRNLAGTNGGGGEDDSSGLEPAGATDTPGVDLADIVAGTGRVTTTPRDVSSIERYKSQLIDAKLELLRLKEVYAFDSPQVARQQSVVEELQRQIDREVEADAANETELEALETDVRRARARLIDLDRKLDQIHLYREMNQRHVGNRIIVEPPVFPKQSDMKFKILIALGAAAGSVVIGIAVAGLLEYTDHTLKTKAAVQKHLGLDLLATVPKTRSSAIARVLDRTRV